MTELPYVGFMVTATSDSEEVDNVAGLLKRSLAIIQYFEFIIKS